MGGGIKQKKKKKEKKKKNFFFFSFFLKKKICFSYLSSDSQKLELPYQPLEEVAKKKKERGGIRHPLRFGALLSASYLGRTNFLSGVMAVEFCLQIPIDVISVGCMCRNIV